VGSSQPGFLDYDHDEIGDSGCPGDPACGSRPPVPMLTLINLVVPAGVLLLT
jgi:hypothetical protein